MITRQILIFINVFCSGIVFTVWIISFFIKSKIKNTIYEKIFWFIVILYLVFLNFRTMGILETPDIAIILQFFIPVGYAIFMFSIMFKKGHYWFNFLYIIPIIMVFTVKKDWMILTYHAVCWTLLIIVPALSPGFKREVPKDKNYKKIMKISVILAFLSIMPFILFNLYYFFVAKKGNVIELMIPPSLALVSLLGLFLSYFYNLMEINTDFFNKMGILKESMGREKQNLIEKVAASLIHEIKNPVTAMKSLNDQLLSRYDEMKPQKVKEYLTIFDEEMNSIKKMSDAFLTTFRRPGTNKKQTISLRQALYSIVDLIQFELQKKECILTLSPTLQQLNVYFDNYQLRQVLINMIYNSMESGASEIIVCGKVDNNSTGITISDNGSGIPEDEQEKIFTPFYTTKNSGSGIGLSLCREIMHENGGNITLVTSKSGETLFKLTFAEREE